MTYVTAFVRFWYDFIVGDDWTIALAVAGALIVVGVAAHAHAPVWWLLPLTVLLTLGVSLLREGRKARRRA